MRYLVVCVLAGLLAWPQRAAAETVGEAPNPKPNVEEPTSSPAPGAEVPNMDTISQRKAGLIISSVCVAGGAAAMGGSFAVANNGEGFSSLGAPGALLIYGAALMVGGIIGIGISGKRLSTAKRKHHELEQAHYGTPRRAQWDLARSRVVF